MRKIGLALLSLALTAGLFAQNVFTYGKNAVPKDEFVRAFNKNPNVTTDRKAALKEYLDMYINFKLKVQAAYDEGLEKDPTQQYEMDNFRRQIADNIINEQANVKELVKQAFERSQKEILLSQIFIPTVPGEDSMQQYQKIQEAYKALKEGKNFETACQEYSTDEDTRKSNGDLGYVTAFTLPYEFENVIYGLKPNEFSSPYKSKIGYHIFKNVSERKSLGSRRVAQILIAMPPGSSEEEKVLAQKKADSVYQLIKDGQNFGKIAAAVSNDLSSNNNNGELPEFTTGTYSPDFEQAAFGLKNTGDVSKPFQTAHGFHIIKLLEAKSAASDITDAATFATVQEKVIKDNRMDQAKKALIGKILTQIKYKPATFKSKDLFAYTDSVLEEKKATVIGVNGKTVIFSFAKKNITGEDWTTYVKSIKNGSETFSPDYNQLLKQYTNVAAEEYYRDHLGDYNADYAKQVQEFKEANLLFAIMEKKVWGTANMDSTGLKAYYNTHKEKYIWPASADALIITANNQQLSDSLLKKLKLDINNWRDITGKFESDVIADSGRYELSQLPVVDRTNFTKGLFTAPTKNANDGSYSFNYIVNIYKEPSQRSFDDSRGMVISDYQQVLEEKWITELRKKYTVAVNEAVFQTIK